VTSNISGEDFSMKIDVNFKASLSQDLYLIRGIAIVLVVIGHVIGFNRQYGMRLFYNSDLSVLGWISDLINTFHMPVFFMASGVGFAVFSKKDTSYSKFFKSKFNKLVIPLLCWSPTYFIFQSLVKGKSFSLLDIINATVYPYEIFWFIHVLIFASFLSFFYFKKFQSPWIYFAISLALFIISLSFPETLIYKHFHWNIFYAFGVVLGFYLYQFFVKLENLPLISLSMLALLSLLLMLVTKYFIPVHDDLDLLRIINGCLAFVGIYIILRSLQKIASPKLMEKLLTSMTNNFVYLGSMSMIIYLFHGYFTRLTIVILIKLLKVPDQYLYFLLASTMGVVCPIIIYNFLRDKSKLFVASIGGAKE
jgi:fucose 4-O-acetylase-like acetyltransferase